MSQEFMDPEIFADFIVEAKEHLETIEPNLLELEKAPDNLSLLNEIFRPMHSLKGASGFLGLNRMNGLAHKAESVMDELRKGVMSATSEIMDVILTCTDALRQMIDSLEKTGTEGDVDTAPIIATLEAILAGEFPAGDASPAAAEEPVAQSEDLAEPEPTVEAGARPLAELGDAAGERVDTEDWINSLPPLPEYVLTAFGEGHLRDFIEEARENSSNLADGLLELEKHPAGQHDLVNDLFRYFHNIKGNSGIIGYHELNSLTHEAETLLNSVRKDELNVSNSLVDILLLVVDVQEALIARIDIPTTKARPFKIDSLLEKLRKAVAGEAIELPEGLIKKNDSPKDQAKTPEASSQAGVPGKDADDAAVFRETVAQQKAHLDEAIAGMRKDGSNNEFADAAFRSLTTVQNSCAYMGLEEIKIYAQRTAGIVDQARSSGLDFSLLADLLEQECSIINDMIQSALAKADSGESAPLKAAEVKAEREKPVEAKAAKEAPAPEAKEAPKPATAAPAAAPAAKPAPAAAPAPAAPKTAAPAAGGDAAAAPKASSTIRVDHEKLDHLMNLIGELIINRNRYTMLARHLETEQNVDVGQVAQQLTETTYAMARISDDLQDTIMKVRMVPVSSVFSRFPRLVRDLSRKSGKEVDLIMEGEETELDKSVVEVIGDPLVHLIRNSMDHGVEPEDVRRAAGKDPKGKVWLRASHRGNSVAIEVEDDGKGIDPEKMREVAIRKGVITPEEAKVLDDREARELIFAPGFSSAETITDISGRGVGMDVVRTNIKSLKGSINIHSEVGKGTRFTLSLPLTLAIIDALMVEVADDLFAIPLGSVSETTKIEARRLTDVKGRKAVTLRGEVLGIVSLAEMLGLPSNMKKQEVLSVVVIHDNDRRLGLVVDRMLERQEIVIKPLGSYLGDLKGISGATIMGDGSVILILDPQELYLMATSKAL